MLPNEEVPASAAPSNYWFLCATLLCIAAVPVCWWLADQRIVPWRIEARWMALRRTPTEADRLPAPGAFVEIRQPGCFGSCPIYRVPDCNGVALDSPLAAAATEHGRLRLEAPGSNYSLTQRKAPISGS